MEVIPMAAVGLVRFAHVAHEVAEAVLPSYRSEYSKHLFTQPALLAILCLMRYEDWTFREAEVRLGEHQELRAALAEVGGGRRCAAACRARPARLRGASECLGAVTSGRRSGPTDRSGRARLGRRGV